MSLLRVDGLSKKFGGVNAVEDLTFEIRPGAVYSIIGPNGAGKTTLLNLLTGVYRPSPGRHPTSMRAGALRALSRTCRCSST
jgi:branched-chain amino acid transport system ATP-binding protein